MILMRVLLGISMVPRHNLDTQRSMLIKKSGIYPGLALVISCWYRRGQLFMQKCFLKMTDVNAEEQQLRFAFLQVGEVIVLATGNIVNFAVSFSVMNPLPFCVCAPFHRVLFPCYWCTQKGPKYGENLTLASLTSSTAEET